MKKLLAVLFCSLIPIAAGAQQRPYGATVIPQLPYTRGASPPTRTITAGGTAQTLFSADKVTFGCWVVNPVTENETLYVDLVGTAGPSSPTSIPVAPGGFYKCDFIPWNGVSIEASTTGHTFYAAAW